MRILVHHRIASRDGQAVHLEELGDALRRAGHVLSVVGPSSYSRVSFGSSVGFVDRLRRRIPPAAYEAMEIGYNVVAFSRLVLAILRFRPDVVYERHNLYLLCGPLACRLCGVPLLLEVNSPLYEERLGTGTLALPLLGRRAQRHMFRRADALLPVTRVLADILFRWGALEARMHVIPNGVSFARFADQPSTAVAKSRVGVPAGILVGFVGFVRAWNSVDRLVRFAAGSGSSSGIRVAIVGDGPARQSIEAEAASLGVAGRVHLPGIVPRDEVASWVAAFDVAVLPAVTPYSSPLKLFEYMAMGRAIVAPDLPNIREVLENGVTAVLFGDAEGDLERALDRVCSDAALRERLGNAARESVVRLGLTWDANAARVAGIAAALVRVGRDVGPGDGLSRTAAASFRR